MRALALPGALIGARLATAVMPGPVRMFSMWVHEAGHAASAWLTGFAAFPGPWFTPIDLERSLMVTLAVAGGLAAGAYRAWQSERKEPTIGNHAAVGDSPTHEGIVTAEAIFLDGGAGNGIGGWLRKRRRSHETCS